MMKHILFALPYLGYTLAQEVCSQQTFTETVKQTVTVTIQPSNGVSPQAVTSRHHSHRPHKSTVIVVSTAVVTPSPAPYPMPNGTFNGTFPTTFRSVRKPTHPISLPLESSEAAGKATAAVSSNAIPTSESLATTLSTASSTVTPAASVAPVTAKSNAASNAGQATFYGGNVSGGMCSFSTYTLPSGVFGTALSDSNWDGAANCGACVSVTGPDGNSITAMVVDQCPGCGNNHLDLFPDAFAKLADPSKGVIDINWTVVPCDITSPIQLHNKEGTSKYWFSMQVVNSNVKVSKLEVSTDGGNTWQATQRQPYNFFENSSGFGTDTVDVKVTDVNGKSITVNGVSVATSSSVTASNNF